MPELPDLEVLKERVQVLVGDSIVEVEVRFPLVFRVCVEGTPDLLKGRTIQEVTRRGKFLIFGLDGLYLVFNMMVAGRLYLVDHEVKKSNTRVVLQCASGRKLMFIDFKKMGKIYVTDDLGKIPQYKELGVEPLSDEFTREKFSELLKDQREIKIVLTDQKIIAGIGNAYSDEILFHAHVNPWRKADSLTSEEVAILYDSIQFVLRNALNEIGKRLEDTSEEIRDFFFVHGKKGQSCPVCGSVIREIEIEKRVTHVCPQCQHLEFPW